jgi:protein-histidine pros-kinase
VPAFAATEIFTYLRGKYPEYFYKEATLNPTNPRDRAADWEADIVNQFRGNAALPEFIGTRDTPTGAALYLARPLKVGNVSCLTCHSTPDKAPPEMIKLYGTANGFGWKMDEIIGAQIVSVPMSVPLQMAQTTWRKLTGWLLGAFGGVLVVGNLCTFVLMYRGDSR